MLFFLLTVNQHLTKLLMPTVSTTSCTEQWSLSTEDDWNGLQNEDNTWMHDEGEVSLLSCENMAHATVRDLPGFHRFSLISVWTRKICWARLRPDRGVLMGWTCGGSVTTWIPWFECALSCLAVCPSPSITILIVLYFVHFSLIMLVVNGVAGWVLTFTASDGWPLMA